MLCLWRRLAATASIQPLAWEHLYVTGSPIKRQKREREREKERKEKKRKEKERKEKRKEKKRKEKKRNQSDLKLHHKMPRNKSIQGGKIFIL